MSSRISTDSLYNMLVQDPDLNSPDLLEMMYDISVSFFNKNEYPQLIQAISSEGYAKKLTHKHDPLGLHMTLNSGLSGVELTHDQVERMISRCDLNEKENFGIRIVSKSYIHLKQQTLIGIYERCDLNIVHSKTNQNLVMKIIDENNNFKKIPANKLLDLILKSDLKQQDKEGLTIPMYVAKYNKTKFLDLSPEQLEQIFDKADFKQVDNNGYGLMHYILKNNAYEHLFLKSNNALKYLDQCDFTHVDNQQNTLVFDVVKYNLDQKIVLSNQDLIHVIKKSNLHHIDKDENTIFSYLLHKVHLHRDDMFNLLNGMDLKKYSKIDKGIGGNILDASTHYSFSPEQLTELLSKCNINNSTGLENILPFRLASQKSVGLSLEQFQEILTKNHYSKQKIKEYSAVFYFNHLFDVHQALDTSIQNLKNLDQQFGLVKNKVNIERLLSFDIKYNVRNTLIFEKFKVLVEAIEIKKNTHNKSLSSKIKVL